MTWQALTLWLLAAPVCFSAASGSDRTTLPRPHLEVDLDATVMHLQCSQPEASSKTAVKVSIQRSSGNLTVASMVSTKATPIAGELFKELPGRVEAEGSFDKKNVKLSVMIPYSPGNFDCDWTYSEQGLEKKTFPLNITDVREDNFVNQEFEYRTIKAHKVNISWAADSSQLHGQMTVSRTMLDKFQKQIKAQEIIFSRNTKGDNLSSDDVLIKQLMLPTSTFQRAALTLYLRDMHGEYNCFIPHEHCYGEDKKLCCCLWSEDSSGLWSEDSSGNLYFWLFIAFIILWLLTCAVCIFLGRFYCKNRLKVKGHASENKAMESLLDKSDSGTISNTDEANHRPKTEVPAGEEGSISLGSPVKKARNEGQPQRGAKNKHPRPLPATATGSSARETRRSPDRQGPNTSDTPEIQSDSTSTNTSRSSLARESTDRARNEPPEVCATDGEREDGIETRDAGPQGRHSQANPFDVNVRDK